MAKLDTLEAQKRVMENKIKHNFNTTDMNLEFILLYSEVAEAAKAWREEDPELGEELADIGIYLLGLAEFAGIDLGAEIEKKMLKNEKREYKVIGSKWIKTENAREVPEREE